MRTIIAAAGLLACLAAPAGAKPYCYAEAVAGGAMGANRIEAGGASVTIATDGYTAGLGLGCDYVLDRMVIGALARASLAKIDGTVDAAKIKSDAAYMAAAKLGYMVNPSSMVYALAGYQMQDIKTPIDKLDGKGLVLGLGFETDLAAGWRIGIEGQRAGLGTFGDDGGGTIKPVTYTGLLTLKRLFFLGE